MSKALLQLHGRAIAGLGTLVAVLYGMAAALMALDIGIRAVRLGALGWLPEAVEYLLYAGTFLAAPWGLRENAHVRIDVLVAAAPRRVAVALEIATDVLGALVAMTLVGFGTIAAHEAWRDKAMQFKTWVTPEWILLAVIPASGLLLLIEFGLRAARVHGVAPVPAETGVRISL